MLVDSWSLINVCMFMWCWVDSIRRSCVWVCLLCSNMEPCSSVHSCLGVRSHGCVDCWSLALRCTCALEFGASLVVKYGALLFGAVVPWSSEPWKRGVFGALLFGALVPWSLEPVFYQIWTLSLRCICALEFGAIR